MQFNIHSSNSRKQQTILDNNQLDNEVIIANNDEQPTHSGSRGASILTNVKQTKQIGYHKTANQLYLF